MHLGLNVSKLVQALHDKTQTSREYIYSEIYLERPLPRETTCLEGPHTNDRKAQISMQLKLSPKTTCLCDHIFMVSGRIFQKRFYCIMYLFFRSITVAVAITSATSATVPTIAPPMIVDVCLPVKEKNILIYFIYI